MPNFVVLIKNTRALVKGKGPVGVGMKVATNGLVRPYGSNGSEMIIKNGDLWRENFDIVAESV